MSMSTSFGWVKRHLQKASHSFFRYPRWKPHTLCEGFFREFLKEWMHLGEVPFVATGTCAASISVIHTSKRDRGSCRDEPAEAWSWQNSCSHRSSGNWWILITLSEYLCSFHSGPSFSFAYWLLSPVALIFAFPFFHLPPNITPLDRFKKQ